MKNLREEDDLSWEDIAKSYKNDLKRHFLDLDSNDEDYYSIFNFYRILTKKKLNEIVDQCFNFEAVKQNAGII